MHPCVVCETHSEAPLCERCETKTRLNLATDAWRYGNALVLDHPAMLDFVLAALCTRV